jgi:cytochrome c oxidase cbb3-type subunit III
MKRMADRKRVDEPTGTETVGHEWDGIEELNTPLPRWWLWTFYITIFWALVYTIFFPAWPLIDRATTGLRNWSSRTELQKSLDAEKMRRAPIISAIAAMPVEQLPQNPKLLQAAIEGGRSAFKVYCVQCHGSGAAGSIGYPNLNDDDWLWGGDIKSIEYTLQHGIRNPDHDQTRQSIMPKFGTDGLLQSQQIDDVTAYVLTFSMQQKSTSQSVRGAVIYTEQCSSCHGATGKGDRAQGAPNLTDRIWLYGSSPEQVRASIARGPAGVMPRWANRLDPATIKMLATYVHSLGGGEALPAQTAEARNVQPQ